MMNKLINYLWILFLINKGNTNTIDKRTQDFIVSSLLHIFICFKYITFVVVVVDIMQHPANSVVGDVEG